jgi:subtilase family serine protease
MRGRTILLALAATSVVAALAPVAEASTAAQAAQAGRPVPAPRKPPAIQAVRNCPLPTVVRVMECMSIRLTGLPVRREAGPDLPQPPPGYGPADLDSAYNLPGGGGSGQTVAIVDAYNDPAAESDLAAYRLTFGLPACTVASGCLRIVNQSGLPSALPANNTQWAAEESLDLDMVSAICPLCDIILVEAGSNSAANLYAAEDRAVTMGAKFISNSWGGVEYSGETSDDVHFNHPGVAITASTGDTGYGAEYPATSQYVTAVGGTSLIRSGNARGWAESVWNNDEGASGSGCSAFEPKPRWQNVSSGCVRRAEADVSATSDPYNGVAVYQTYGASGWVEAGGTSAAAPIIAAIYALAGTPLAGSYPAEYPYLNPPGGLYDVVSGNNGNCGIPLCTAGTGWDGPTGLGSPDGKGAFIPPIPLFLANPGGRTTPVNTPVSLTLNGVGGFTPYTWTSTALPAGLSLNGSTGVISGTPTTVGTTTVTVTVHSTDGTTASTTFNWTVQSVLSLGISGPSMISGKGTYTYTAVTSGYTSPSFSWSERFCADDAGSGCTSWQNIGGGGTITRVLNKDCSGSGTNTYWLQVTATNSDGRQQTSQLIVELCQGPV